METKYGVGRGRSKIVGRARRLIVVGLLATVAAVVPGSSAQADSVIPGLGGEILGNPGAGPVVPEPDVFPLPPVLPGGPGLVPAPPGPSREILPVPGPIFGMNDGPGSGPTVPPPVHVDADTPPAEAGRSGETGSSADPRPVGKLSRPTDSYLASLGINPHRVKEAFGMDSGYDIYLDRNRNMFGVAKGEDPKSGTWLGHVDDWR